jgi:Ni,Fe-hydrogenase III large subunit/Ni,Fe-hydrogenase III component G
MNRYDWLPDYLSRLESEHVVLREETDPQTLTPAHRLVLDVEDWGTAAKVSAAFGHRHAGVWGEQLDDRIIVHACLAFEGDYLVLETSAPLEQPVLPSHTPYYRGVDRLERHLQDMLGVVFSDHPDNRRWSRHQAWAEGRYPLRQDFPLAGESPKRTPADSEYRFIPVSGSGVYEIPVGPVHAGIIEPGHFRFHAVGEQVLSLEERLGYVHKGIEKIAVGRDVAGLARLAGRVSGDSTVAHTWAACMAMERAADVSVPPRALAMRAILAERERIANHLGDIGAICNDVGFAFAYMQCNRLREEWQRMNLAVFGHRLLMDRIAPGGVAVDVNEKTVTQLQSQNQSMFQALEGLLPILNDQPSLEDRLVSTGILTFELAQQFACTGYLGKASGVDYDVRRDHQYVPYDSLQVESPCLTAGDVAARVQVRASEIQHSLQLITQLLETMPEGAIQSAWPIAGVAAEGIGMVEGWRGEIVSYVRLGDDGRVKRFFPRDPSWFSWPALEQLIHGNIVADFPVCNKSVNASYSGHDL